MARGLRFDRNPLRRGTDRAEAAIKAGLLAAFLALTPVAVATAMHMTYTATARTVQAEHSSWRQVPAVAGTGVAPSWHLRPCPTAHRLAIVLNEHSGSPPACRVEAPDRVLRMWTLLNTANDELHQVKLPPGAAARLERELRTVTTELERSVSPVLADELHHLIGQGQNASPTLAELRVDYACVLGWTGGLVIAMLDQLASAELAPARPAVPGGASSS